MNFNKNYVIAFITDYNFTDKDVKAITSSLIKDHGEVQSSEIINKINLAYSINNESKASFVISKIVSNSQEIITICNNFKKNNKIFRFLIQTDKAYNRVNVQYNLENIQVLRKYLTDACRILGRKYTLLSRKEQNKLSNSIKNARFLGLIPYFFRG